MAIKFATKVLPDSLKDVLKKSGKKFGENLNKKLDVVQLDGVNVVKIDFDFQSNANMHGGADSITNALNESQSENYSNLVHSLGVFCFGDNVKHYDTYYKNDKIDGGWKLLIRDITLDGIWISLGAYLIPDGFEISE